MAKIILEREKCIGCGSCAVLCPKLFELKEDGKARLKGSQTNKKSQNDEIEVKKAGCGEEAVEACPVQCIKITK